MPFPHAIVDFAHVFVGWCFEKLDLLVDDAEAMQHPLTVPFDMISCDMSSPLKRHETHLRFVHSSTRFFFVACVCVHCYFRFSVVNFHFHCMYLCVSDKRGWLARIRVLFGDKSSVAFILNGPEIWLHKSKEGQE